jgi:CheY-like chemotaxis protein
MLHQGKLEGARILVVEDEALIAMLVEEMLSELGCIVTDIAGTVEQGLRLAAPGKATIDAAILDVNLAGDKVFPIAEALDAQGIPFVFATGYGATGVEGRFTDRPVVAKPFSRDALEHCLATALA